MAGRITAVRPGGRVVSYGATSGLANMDIRRLFWKQLDVIGSTMGSPRDFAEMVADHDLTYVGDLPCNTHGGLLSYAHPGMPGSLLHFLEVVKQLRGECGSRQVAGAELGLVHSLGAGFATNATTIATALNRALPSTGLLLQQESSSSGARQHCRAHQQHLPHEASNFAHTHASNMHAPGNGLATACCTFQAKQAPGQYEETGHNRAGF